MVAADTRVRRQWPHRLSDARRNFVLGSVPLHSITRGGGPVGRRPSGNVPGSSSRHLSTPLLPTLWKWGPNFPELCSPNPSLVFPPHPFVPSCQMLLLTPSLHKWNHPCLGKSAGASVKTGISRINIPWKKISQINWSKSRSLWPAFIY